MGFKKRKRSFTRKRKFGAKLSFRRGIPNGSLRSRAFCSVPKIYQWFRFTCSATGTFPIGTQNIFGALGCMCTIANSAAIPMFNSFKLHRVRILGAPGTAPGEASPELQWNLSSASSTGNPPYASGEIITAVSNNPSYPAFIDRAPPHGSNASMCQVYNSSAGVASLFTIFCQTNTIIEICVSATMNVGTSTGPQVPSQAIATGTLAQPYWLALDGPTTNELTPIGLPTTH